MWWWRWCAAAPWDGLGAWWEWLSDGKKDTCYEYRSGPSEKLLILWKISQVCHATSRTRASQVCCPASYLGGFGLTPVMVHLWDIRVELLLGVWESDHSIVGEYSIGVFERWWESERAGTCKSKVYGQVQVGILASGTPGTQTATTSSLFLFFWHIDKKIIVAFVVLIHISTKQ